MAQSKPAVMVNSCTGKMGRAVAEAATRAGLHLLPYTLCGAAEAAPGAAIDVAGQRMELVGPAERDALIARLKQEHPGFVMVDYTIPGAEVARGRGQVARSAGGQGVAAASWAAALSARP